MFPVEQWVIRSSGTNIAKAASNDDHDSITNYPINHDQLTADQTRDICNIECTTCHNTVQACSDNKALHIVISKRPSYEIRVRDQHALLHDGSRGQRIEVHWMIRMSQSLVNLRREVAGVWEPLMFSRMSKCLQCTIMQRHRWWLANYEGYRFRGMRWRVTGSVWLVNLFLEPHK